MKTSIWNFIFIIFTALGGLFMSQSASAFEVQTLKSPKGIEYWLVQSDILPLVTMNFSIQAGSAQDPEGKEGLAYLHSGLLDEGAGELDSQAFQQALDKTQVKLSFDNGLDYFNGSLRTLTEQLDEAERLASLALNNPRFDEEAVERVKKQILASINARKFDAETLASKAWFEAAFEGHPYALPKEGTEESVMTLNKEDLKTYHQNAIAQQNLYISIVGDISKQRADKLIDSIFGDLPKTQNLTKIEPVVPINFGHKHVDLDVPQTALRFSVAGIARKDPDFMVAYVMNHILGGGSFTSRLWNEVREDRGLAYSVYSYLYPLDYASIFFGGAATEKERVETTIEVISKEVQNIAENGVSQEELDAAKTYLIGSYPLRFDTSTSIARQLTGLQTIGFDPDYITKRESIINEIEVEDIKRVAKRIFEGNTLSFVTVGR